MSFNFMPRVLRREAAAFYLSISPEQLDTEVAAGRILSPFRVAGEIYGWDRQDLDLWVVSTSLEQEEEAINRDAIMKARRE
jgi:hypothetical protein